MQILFWKNWAKKYRLYYNVLSGILVASVIYFIVSFFAGEGFVFDWGVIDIKEQVPVTVETFSKGLFSFEIPGENYVITQRFRGNELSVNITGAYIFLLFFAVSTIVSLTIITNLKRFWYVVGMAIFIVILVNLKLEHLTIFGRIDRVPLIVTFFLFIPLSYYFHAIKPETSFKTRLLGFAISVGLFAILVYFFSEAPRPFFYLANYGIFGPLLITVIFILMISHELIYGFLFLITFSNNPESKHSLRHLSLISLIYLLNILLLYLYETKIIFWEFYFINPYLLFFISAIVGVWGLIKRSELFENTLKFYPYAAYFYLALAILSFATIGYFFATANDPILEVVEDTIIYGHLGFGLIFFIYLIANFASPLNKNMQVYKIAYKPKTMPYFTFRFVGLIAVAAMFLKENIEVPIYHSLSGYYNGIGDLYTANNDLYAAEQYYKLGGEYGYQNHRSNYALASLALKQNDLTSALIYYQEALAKRPTEFSFVNLSNIYLIKDRYFDALFALSNGYNYFPDSGPIQNNLGLALGVTNIVDSAFLYLRGAYEKSNSREIAATNLLGLTVKKDLSLPFDSLIEEFDDSYLPTYNNELVLSNRSSVELNSTWNIIKDSALSLRTSAYLINHSFNHFPSIDSNLVNNIRAYQSYPDNFRYREALGQLLAFAYYENFEVVKAFETMKLVAADHLARSGHYFNILGLWSMKHDAWDLAEGFFTEAINRRKKEAILNRAIVFLESGNFIRAKDTWENLGESEELGNIPGMMLEIIQVQTIDSVINRSDEFKYHYIRYRKDNYETEKIDLILENIQNRALKNKAILYLASHYYNQNDWNTSKRLIDSIKETPGNVENLKEYLILKMKLTAEREAFKELKDQYEQFQELSHLEMEKSDRILFEALIMESEGLFDQAKVKYEKLGFGNPLFLKGVLHAARFFREQIGDDIKAYEILVEALQLNSNSVPLLKAYILQSLRANLSSFAENALESLKNRISDEEYEDFYKTYQELAEKELKWEF